MPRFLGPILLSATLLACGCAKRQSAPAIDALYNRAARYHGQERNPVIVIPGILGSRLVDSRTNQLAWGSFSGGYADPSTPTGARVAALPMRQGAALAELRDDVVPDGVLDTVKVNLLGLSIEQKAYVNILRTLGAGGYRDLSLTDAGPSTVDYGPLHYTCFQFAYDWRRDLPENAALLHDFIRERAQYVREQRRAAGVPNDDVKFDIVAHSMGGLVARYYLMFGDAPLPEDGSVPAVRWAGGRTSSG